MSKKSNKNAAEFFKKIAKDTRKVVKVVKTGFKNEITNPLKKEADKVKPLLVQTNQEITKAATTVQSQVNLVARQVDASLVKTTNKVTESIDKTSAQIINPLVTQASPTIDRVGQELTKAAQTVTNTLQNNNERDEAIAKIFTGPKKSTGAKVKTPPIKPTTKKSSAKVTAQQEELSNISPAEPTIPNTSLPESKGISGTTLGVMVAGGVTLGLGGAFFGEFSSLAGLTMNVVGGIVSGVIAGGAAAVATHISGGSPKIEQLAENAKETGRGYLNQIAQSKFVQQAKTYLIKAAVNLVAKELKNPKTQKAIKDEIAKEVKNEFYTKPTEAMRKRAKEFGQLFKTTSSAKKYKAPTKNKAQQSR